MPWVGFEPTIPVFKRAKTVYTLCRAPIVIDKKHVWWMKISPWHKELDWNFRILWLTENQKNFSCWSQYCCLVAVVLTVSSALQAPPALFLYLFEKFRRISWEPQDIRVILLHSRGVTIDGVWIGEWIHWPLIHTARKYKYLQRQR
jgi:hypothetical protein